MTTTARILAALPVGAVVSYTGFEGLRYSWTRLADGRFEGRYTSAGGALCANGRHDARTVARDVDTGRDVDFS